MLCVVVCYVVYCMLCCVVLCCAVSVLCCVVLCIVCCVVLCCVLFVCCVLCCVLCVVCCVVCYVVCCVLCRVFLRVASCARCAACRIRHFSLAPCLGQTFAPAVFHIRWAPRLWSTTPVRFSPVRHRLWAWHTDQALAMTWTRSSPSWHAAQLQDSIDGRGGGVRTVEPIFRSWGILF